MSASLYQKCIEAERFDLLSEWDAVKNGPLTPWTVSPGGHQRVWWKCRAGHEWQATVNSRAKTGCPICAGTVNKKRLARMKEIETAARRTLSLDNQRSAVSISG